MTSTPNTDVVSLRLPSITVKWWLCTVYRKTCVYVCMCVPAGRWPIMLLFPLRQSFFSWFTLYHPSIISLYLYIISVSLHFPLDRTSPQYGANLTVTVHRLQTLRIRVLSFQIPPCGGCGIRDSLLNKMWGAGFERTVSPRRKNWKTKPTWKHKVQISSRNDLMYHTIFIMLAAFFFKAGKHPDRQLSLCGTDTTTPHLSHQCTDSGFYMTSLGQVVGISNVCTKVLKNRCLQHLSQWVGVGSIKGPVWCPVSDLYFSSWTLNEAALH